MQLYPYKIYEALVKRGIAWADALAAADILEETRKIVLAQLMDQCEEKSAVAKEAFALRSPAYQEHVTKMVQARKEANRAKVRYEDAKIWSELKRTEAANLRATMREAV